MINIFLHENNWRTIRRLRKDGSHFSNLRPVIYQDVFRTLSVPTGTAIFTDLEFLSPLEREVAASMAMTIQQTVPGTPVLNHPAYACERYELLRRMQRKNASPVTVLRVDSGELPEKYPVFIRAEDGCAGPETGLLENDSDYLAAVAALKRSGKPAKGRIALSYEAEPQPDGYFRKYGVFRIGEHIVPQHILYNRDWVVKSNELGRQAELVAEELRYMRENPHKSMVMDAFETGELQFGRADFGFKNGQFVLYEINTNPTFPRFKGGSVERSERRDLIRELLKQAFNSIDSKERFRASGEIHAAPALPAFPGDPLLGILDKEQVAREDLSAQAAERTQRFDAPAAGRKCRESGNAANARARSPPPESPRRRPQDRLHEHLANLAASSPARPARLWRGPARQS